MADRVRKALYPGTFDPIHNGHIDIIGRAARLMDHLVIGVATNIGKGPLFSIDERVALVRQECAAVAARTGASIEVLPFDCLLIEFARRVGAITIVRGLRAVSDFDYEFQMAGMNARLDPNIETLFLPASERQHFISSRFVKEIAMLGGDITTFVTPNTFERVTARIKAPPA
jgi:pantetheine-phosphate adenylyltransferase